MRLVCGELLEESEGVVVSLVRQDAVRGRVCVCAHGGRCGVFEGREEELEAANSALHACHVARCR